MPYRLTHHDHTLRDALRRIAGEELEAALAPFAQATLSPTDVHDIRKRLKKLRGLLRLVRPGFAGFAAETAILRETGALLASRRDAEVRLATFAALFSDAPAALAPLHRHLEGLRDRHAGSIDRARAEEALRGLQDRARHWKLKGKDSAILREGLSRTRSRAAGALHAAAADPQDEAMHDWRKRAKDTWYQARLLAPIWPEALDPLAEAAGTLTEDLGLHHDIAVLRATPPPGLLAPGAARLLERRAAREQRAIEARAFPLGRRLFAGEPKEVARLWVDWWRLWRDQAASAPDRARSIRATVSSTP